MENSKNNGNILTRPNVQMFLLFFVCSLIAIHYVSNNVGVHVTVGRAHWSPEQQVALEQPVISAKTVPAVVTTTEKVTVKDLTEPKVKTLIASEKPSELPMTYDRFYGQLSVKAPEDKRKIAYIKRFANTAVAEMHKFDIPASISLAQGILESGSGASDMAKTINNHFGIKCKVKGKCPASHCKNYHDDNPNDYFRKYGSAWESWRDHSKLLQKNRYIGLKEYGKDYKSWAHGLKKAGYATDKRYAEKLIHLIERFNLQYLDQL